MTWRKGKVNVEKNSTQRGELANTTWSVEKLDARHRDFLHETSKMMS